RKNARGSQRGHRSRLVEPDYLGLGPAPAQALACGRVGAVGDQDLGLGAVLGQGGDAFVDIRKAVDRRDNDRERGSRAHRRRSMSKCPSASANAQAALNAKMIGRLSTARARKRSLANTRRRTRKGIRNGTPGEASTPTRLRIRLKCSPR